ncbi:MAG: LytTR family DNA-binding domain-containing protein, partial [Trichococcus flocculiformis]
TNGQYEFYGKLNELEKRYPNLFRVNRSCLINPVNIREIDYSTRTIRFGEELSCSFPLGKAKKIKEVVKVDFDL